MAHFAQIKDGIVTNVIVVHNNELLVNGIEVESKGSEFCHKLLGGTWVQTSYNHNMRKQYASIGYTYDVVKDQFVEPKPFASWLLDANNDWQAPTPKPEGNFYWDEESLSWLAIPVG